MAELQRSSVSFRRQGSSGLIWDDRFQSGELNKVKWGGGERMAPLAIDTPQRSSSNGGRGGREGYMAGKVTPMMVPPSPKVSACGLCGIFGKQGNKGRKSKKHPPLPISADRGDESLRSTARQISDDHR